MHYIDSIMKMAYSFIVILCAPISTDSTEVWVAFPNAYRDVPVYK